MLFDSLVFIFKNMNNFIFKLLLCSVQLRSDGSV